MIPPKQTNKIIKVYNGGFIMGRKSKFTSKQKIEACEKYINGYGSICSISDELGIAYETFRRWLLKYRNNGKNCFEELNINNSYTS